MIQADTPYAVILCNGAPPSKALFRYTVSSAHLLITADGGTHTALRYESKPDVATGDFDSYDPNSADFETVLDADQETNDLEKALALAIRRGVDRAVLLGATGLRLDHTLKNLSVLKQFDDRFEQLIISDNYGDIFLAPRKLRLELAAGTAISLFPLSGRVEGITTDGLKYTLDDEKLENGIRDGSSNEVVSDPITITHRSGDLLIYIHRPDRTEV